MATGIKIKRRLPKVILQYRLGKRQARISSIYFKGFPRKAVTGYKIEITARYAYESPRGIALVDSRGDPLASLALGFERNALRIYAIQGLTHKYVLEKFAKKAEIAKGAKIRWADYLVGRAIGHARKVGFRQVKLLRPEANETILWRELDEKKVNALKSLYYTIARRFGFKKAEGEPYMVMKL